MKRAFLSVVCLIILASAPTLAGDAGWYDMQGCGMCSNLSAQPGLLENLGWEHHVIKEGMMSVTIFKTPEAEMAYAQARADMQKTGAEMHAGAEVDLCGFCNSMMGMVMAGASIEEVDIDSGAVVLITSDDPAMVEKIHAHAERSIEELAKMEASTGS